MGSLFGSRIKHNNDDIRNTADGERIRPMTSPFTDEQIAELTKMINYNNSMGSYFESPIKNEDLIAILRRLEAAENAYLTYRNDPEVRHTPEQVEAGLAWCKSAGRDK